MFDWDYSPDWGKRKGFAQIALDTGVPIIPIFTQNIRQAFETISVGGSLWKIVYEKTKLAIMPPVYGGLPVNLTTHIGDHIIAREGDTASQVKERVEQAMKEMIANHQVTKSLSRAVTERLVERRQKA